MKRVIFVFGAIVLIGCSAPIDTILPSASADAILPDISAAMAANGGFERRQNTRDEYAPLIHRYGQPSSILSTENDPEKPPIPSMIVRYDAAQVKVSLVPIGCVDAFIRAADAMGDLSRYPALAKDFVDGIRAHPCVRSAPGWTIMGYIDSSDNMTISAELVRMRLGRMKD